MPETPIAETLASPAVRIGMWVLALLLGLVLLRELRRIPAALLALMATAFLDMVGLLIVVPLLPLYVKEFVGEGVRVLGFEVGPAGMTGMVVSAFTIAQLVTAPLWGRFSDRHGRRPALLIALGASAAAHVVFAFAGSLWMLLLARVVQGAGGGTVGVIQAYVADSTGPSQRARALGWVSAATNLGVVLGPLLGSEGAKLGQEDLWPGEGSLVLGTSAPGLLAALLCVASMAFAARYLKEPERHSGAVAPPRTPGLEAMRRVIVEVREPAPRLIWIYAIAIGAFQGAMSIMALLFAARFGFDKESIGYVYTYIGAINVFARVWLLGRLIDRHGEAKLSRFGTLLLASGLLGIAWSRSLPTLAIVVALLPLGTSLTFPCVSALLSRVIADHERGMFLGIQQTFGAAARLVAPLVYGLCYDELGKSVPFVLAAALVSSTLLLGIGLDRHARGGAK